MKRIIVFLLALLPLISCAQIGKRVPFGGTRAVDTGYEKGSLIIDSNLKISSLVNSDPTMALSTDSYGNFVLVPVGGGTQDLNSVLGFGNTSALSINIQGTLHSTNIDTTLFQINAVTGTVAEVVKFQQNTVEYDYVNSVGPVALTHILHWTKNSPTGVTSRDWWMPHESYLDTILSSLMLHKSKFGVLLDSGTGITCSLRYDGIIITDASNNFTIHSAIGFGAYNSSTEGIQFTAGTLQFNKGAYNHQTTWMTLTANRTTKIPNLDGTFDLRDTVITVTDADYTIPIANSGFYILPSPAAARVLTLPSSPPLGTVLKIYRDNASSGFDWTFTGGTITRPSGVAFTTFADGTLTMIEYTGSVWIILNF